MSIRVNLDPLKTTVAFSYLGRMVAFNNSKWGAPYVNLRKYLWQWRVVSKVLTNTGATVRARSMIYKLVVQTVLLHRSKSWVVAE